MNYLMFLIVTLKNIIFFTKPYWYETTDNVKIRNTQTSTNPLFKNYDGNISTIAEPSNVKLTAGHELR